MFKKLLVANDGSLGGAAALASALELAKQFGVGLDMICVEEMPRFPASIDEVTETQAEALSFFDAIVGAARAKAATAGVPLKALVVSGHPVSTIAEFVRDGGYDLLVVGFIGHSALYNRIIGGAADRLVELAPCKVLVVK